MHLRVLQSRPFILLAIFFLTGTLRPAQAQSNQPFKAGLVTTDYDETTSTATVEVRVQTSQDFLGGNVSGLQLTLRAPEGENTDFGDVISSEFGLQRGTKSSESGTEGGFKYQYYSAGGTGASQNFTAGEEVVWATVEIEGDQPNVIGLAVSSYAQNLNGGGVDGTYFLQYSGSSNDTDGSYYHANNSTAQNEFYQTTNLNPGETKLPVELVHFNAIVKNETALLKWETASETQNAGFAIEQKEQGSDTWTKIGFREGAGTTNRPQTYDFQVENLTPGAYRFRLKQIDVSGVFEYSPIVGATVSLDGDFQLTEAYPNPSQERAHLKLTVQKGQRVEAVLYNTLGQAVERLYAGRVKANTPREIVVESSTLASGTYVVSVTGQTFSATRKLTRVK